MTEAKAPSLSPVKRALLAMEKMKAELESVRQAASPIAIIGIGCRLPGRIVDANSYWQALLNGEDLLSEPPGGRWDMDEFYSSDPDEPGKINCRRGGFVENIEQFDAGFFGITPREALSTDPQQRMTLETAWEAMENAGMRLDQISGSNTGVFMGVLQHDYATLQLNDLNDIDVYTGTGGTHSIIPNRLSYFLNIKGPSIAVDTACSASLVALYLACTSLNRRECDLAFAGGVNAMIDPSVSVATTKLRALSPTGKCSPFDASADGFVRGEGCGILLLKRLPDAERDQDRIIAVIHGGAINHDGRSNGLTAPSSTAQQALIETSLQHARIAPEKVGYVEAHGTGTRLGDPIEVEALAATYGAARNASPCYISSVKSNIGHLESAAGAASAIKAALAVQKGVIPATINFRELNPHIELSGTRLQIADRNIKWDTTDGKRFAAVSGFGIGGANAHLILSSSSGPSTAAGSAEALHYPIIVSAHSRASLSAAARNLAAELRKPEYEDRSAFADFCYTSSLRRSYLQHTITAAAGAASELSGMLQAFADGEESRGVFSIESGAQEGATAFVFSGQGPKFWPLNPALLNELPDFAKTLRECDSALRSVAGWSLVEELTRTDGSRLDSAEYSQPAMTALQISFAAEWKARGVMPQWVVGHSLGEIAAAWAAGAINTATAMRIVHHRGRLIQTVVGQGKMAFVDLPADAISKRLAGMLDQASIGAINSPTNTVVSGEPAAIEKLVAGLANDGVFARILESVEFASHSPQMDPIAARLGAALEGIPTQAMTAGFMSTANVSALASEELGAAYWGRNLRETVRFADAVDRLLDEGVANFVEIGPHPVLSASLSQCITARGRKGVVLHSWRKDARSSAYYVAAFAALKVAQGAAPELGPMYGANRRLIDLPGYAWERKKFWKTAISRASSGAAMTSPPQEDHDVATITPDAIALAPSEDRLHLFSLYLRERLADVIRTSVDSIELSRPLKDMGLDSLTAVELRSVVHRDLGFDLPVARLMSGGSIIQIADVCADRLNAIQSATTSSAPGVPLSWLQKGAWITHSLAPESSLGNVHAFVMLDRNLNPESVEIAFRTLLEENPEFQSRITTTPNSELRLTPFASDTPDFASIDVSAWTRSRIRNTIQFEIDRSFDPQRELPIRLRLGIRSEKYSLLLLVGHRVACDEYSLAHSLQRVIQLHDALSEGQKTAAPAGKTYSEYSAREEDLLSVAKYEEYLESLRGNTAMTQSALNLPTDYERPAIAKYTPRVRNISIPVDAIKTTEDEAPAHFIAALLTLLQKLTDSDAPSIGIAGRSVFASDYNACSGPFLNAFPLSIPVKADETFQSVRTRVAAVLSQSAAQKSYPFARLVHEICPLRFPARTPIFQVLFTSEEPESALNAPKAHRRWRTTVSYELILQYRKFGGKHRLTLVLPDELFRPTTRRLIAARLKTILKAVQDSPATAIKDLPSLSPEDRQRIAIAQSNKRADASRFPAFLESFENTAKSLPGASAILQDGVSLTYADLLLRTKAIASRIRQEGGGRGVVVALCHETNADGIAAWLAIIQTGATCAPIDPAYTDIRLRLFLDELKPALIVTNQANSAKFGMSKSKVLLVDSLGEAPRAKRQTRVKIESDDAALCYVNLGYVQQVKRLETEITAISHRNLAQFLRHTADSGSVRPGQRTAQLASLSSIFAIKEIVSTLATGGELVLPDRADEGSGVLEIARFLQRLQIDRIYLSCIKLEELAEYLIEQGIGAAQLREIIVCGDRLYISENIAGLLSAMPGASLEYQLTLPNALILTSNRNREFTTGYVNAGRLIQGAEARILNRADLPVPCGVTGDLYIGGQSVPPGGVWEKRRTINVNRSRFSHSGLNARFMNDGSLDIVGNVANQAVIRSLSINLEQIRGVIEQHPAVIQALVRVESANNQERIVAHVATTRIVERLTMLIRCVAKHPESDDTVNLITKDISIDGLQLLSVPTYWKESEEVDLELYFPSLDDPLQVRGIITRVDNGRAGVSFRMDSKDRVLLKYCISSLIETEEMLTPDVASDLRISFKIPFRVRKGSQSAELITDQLSPGGIRTLRGPEWLREKDVVRLTIRLPGSNRDLSLDTMVTWTKDQRMFFSLEFSGPAEHQYAQFFSHNARSQLLSLTHLRAFLKERLPYYLIPDAFVLLDALPLLPDGSVNYLNIRSVERIYASETRNQSPRTPVEAMVARIWSELLKKDEIGIFQNFFDLGGDSLSAVALTESILREFQLEITLADVWTQPTIADISELIVRKNTEVEEQAEHRRALQELEQLSRDELKEIVQSHILPGEPDNES